MRVLALLLLTTVTSAQTSFTELALSDPDFDSGPDTDFWVSSAAPADVDGDGDLDLLIAGYFVDYVAETTEERLTLYRNDGSGGTALTLTAVPLDLAGIPGFIGADIAWADVDGDGDPDAVVGGDGVTVLYRNEIGTGAGTLVPTATVLPPYAEHNFDYSSLDQSSLSWGDVDNDGDPDLLVPAIANPDPDEFGFDPTALLRNDGPGAGGAWTFTQVAALDTTWNAVSRWGDTDGDGDLDLLLGNISTIGDADGSFLTVYRNDDGALTPADTGIAPLLYGMIDWGDADSDGDLDVLVAGLTPADENGEGGSNAVRVLYRTSGGYDAVTLIDDGPGSDWLNFNAASWADYDSDGDVDVLVAGEVSGVEGAGGQAQVYVNDGGTFTAGPVLPAPPIGFSDGAFVWFDLDGDGDLDYFTSGGYGDASGSAVEARSRLFRNDAAGDNALPGAPGGLAATPTASGVALAWAPAADDGTPTEALTYNLWVGPAGGLDADRAALPERGNVSTATEWALDGLAPGTYAWSVQAVDTAFDGGPVASGTFVVGTSAGDPGAGTGALSLSAVGPNPARSAARVTVALAETGPVTVAVVDALGRRVATLHDGAMAAGAHVLDLDASTLPAGVYVVRAETDGGSATQRLVVVR